MKNKELEMGEGKIIDGNIIFLIQHYLPGASVCLLNAMCEREIVAVMLVGARFNR